MKNKVVLGKNKIKTKEKVNHCCGDDVTAGFFVKDKDNE